MKKRNITLFTAIAAAAAFAPAAQAAAIVIPGDGYTGDFRIALITSSRTTADANNPISFYNGIVTTAATAVTELNDLGTTWTAIGSTIAVDARDNTGTNPTISVGIPIYTTNGVRIADDNADLWDGTLAQRLYYDIGTPDQGGWNNHGFYDSTWTGTKTDGTQAGDGTTNPQDGNALSTGPGSGGNNLTLGGSYRADSGWIDAATGSGDDGRGRHLLGMSGVISGAVPEPSTMGLLALSGLALLRRRRA